MAYLWKPVDIIDKLAENRQKERTGSVLGKTGHLSVYLGWMEHDGTLMPSMAAIGMVSGCRPPLRRWITPIKITRRHQQLHGQVDEATLPSFFCFFFRGGMASYTVCQPLKHDTLHLQFTTSVLSYAVDFYNVEWAVRCRLLWCIYNLI